MFEISLRTSYFFRWFWFVFLKSKWGILIRNNTDILGKTSTFCSVSHVWHCVDEPEQSEPESYQCSHRGDKENRCLIQWWSLTYWMWDGDLSRALRPLVLHNASNAPTDKNSTVLLPSLLGSHIEYCVYVLFSSHSAPKGHDLPRLLVLSRASVQSVCGERETRGDTKPNPVAVGSMLVMLLFVCICLYLTLGICLFMSCVCATNKKKDTQPVEPFNPLVAFAHWAVKGEREREKKNPNASIAPSLWRSPRNQNDRTGERSEELIRAVDNSFCCCYVFVATFSGQIYWSRHLEWSRWGAGAGVGEDSGRW